MICGIDPGLTGGISFVNGESVYAYRTPIYKNGKKRYLDLVAVAKLFETHNPELVIIEKQQAMPGQGVSSTFKTGMNYGIYLGMLATMGVAFEEVSPRKWKNDLKVPANKDEARKRATELLPQGSEKWRLKCEDGVAESAMLAYWGQLP